MEAALGRQDVSARRASLDVVGNDGLVRDIRAGRLPGVDRLEALFEHLGLAFCFGPRRRPPETGRAGSAFAEPGAGMSDLDRREGADTVALIDTAAPRRGGPWRCCHRSGGEVRIGEVQFVANATLILPEAPGRPARVLIGDDRARVAVLGHVVWSGARTPEAGDLPGS